LEPRKRRRHAGRLQEPPHRDNLNRRRRALSNAHYPSAPRAGTRGRPHRDSAGVGVRNGLRGTDAPAYARAPTPRTPSAGGAPGSSRAYLTTSVPRVHERRDREPVVGDPRLLALVEVPTLLAGKARARQRRLRRVLELEIDHDDRRDEAHLVRILDRIRT